MGEGWADGGVWFQSRPITGTKGKEAAGSRGLQAAPTLTVTLTLPVCSPCSWSSLCGVAGSHERGPEGRQITGVQREQSLRGYAQD